ncbi:MAG: ethanolamine utilization protein EutH [Bacillaceae bacterium]
MRDNKMNVVIAILLLFALLGVVDKILGGKLGVAREFDHGLSTMGSLCLSMVGIYCVAITALRANPEVIASLSNILPFDASLLAGALLAPDLGGYAIASEVAATSQISIYTGVLVASTLGCLISFVLPISLGSIKRDEVMDFMQGVLWGIVALPLGLAIGGVVIGISLPTLAANLWPVLILCVLLCITLFAVPKVCITVLAMIGQFVRIGGIVLFCVVTFGVFVPTKALVPDTLFWEVLVIAFKITVVVCGSMVASRLVLDYCGRVVKVAARILHVNDYAIIGLFISLATSISMLPFYSKMDKRGKVINAAFTVSGAFALGGQLAFVSSVTSGINVAAYLVCKFLGGIAAVLLASRFTKDQSLQK